MNKTFVVGADKNYEEYLQWWFENVRRYDNETHITVADFGVSKEVRKWIELHADHILDYPKHEKSAWFHKPQTLIDAPYEYKCWIDIDCEVLTNISEIFDFVDGTNIAVTPDPCRTKEVPGEEWLATGVNVVKGVPEILKLWANRCTDTNLRGDQEVLHYLLRNYELITQPINVIPLYYQWLRLLLARGIDHPNKKIIHWTGEAGKKIIRNKINGN
jgi:hypothetical protein